MSSSIKTRRKPVVTIDGPVATGKSTVARLLARRLGYTYIDTGAMYRCVALSALEAEVDLDDADAAAALARTLDIRLEAGQGPDETSQRVILNGKDVSEAIRTPLVSRSTSSVADNEQVRSHLVSLQRQMGERGGLVMEGRDIGTVVYPDAEVKFYLDADESVRARRRYEELHAKGIDVSLPDTLQDLRIRDERDRTRPVGALRIAEGAIVVDTSSLTIEQTVDRLEAIVHGL